MNNRGRTARACKRHGHFPAHKCRRCLRAYHREYGRLRRKTVHPHDTDSEGNIIRQYRICKHPKVGMDSKWARNCPTCNPPKERTVPLGHGTVACYKRGCRCALCTDANTAYHRKYRHRKKRERD